MKTITRDFVRVVLVAAFTVAPGGAQHAEPDKHVKDIRAEQTQEIIAASSLCKRVKVGVHGYVHRREVDPAMLETDLYRLMQNSDDVILASDFIDEIDALAPSGEDAIEYYDVKVLRTFKGSHKVGDLVTYTLPRGGVYCGPKPLQGSAVNSGAVTSTGGSEWGKTRFQGPFVLFLRRSRGEETELTPGLRLAGGDGLQGMFALRDHYDRVNYTDCLGVLPGGAAKCIAELEASAETVKIPYGLDPMHKKYDTMPVPSFLIEVQSVANSLASAGPLSNMK
jgi:hypothetical protein